MKLNHLNLAVTEIRVATDLLVPCFDLRAMGGDASCTFHH